MSRWNGKNVLVIGDSLTADGRWQKKFSSITGANIRTHAYGGIGIIEIIEGTGPSGNDIIRYDPITCAGGDFGPLSPDDIGWADLIILLMAYNERHIEYGGRGDMYPEDVTLRGKYSYALKKIYEMMDETGNGTCRIMLVTPHCIGRYAWVDADGYEEFPAGSGRTMETMAQTICDIAASHNLPCYDAWHNCGINRYTWKYFAASSKAIRDEIPDDDISPYPQYADQAHLNDAGYARIGECIAAFAETI